MFDEIKCKYRLPLPQYQDLQFQTKDTSEQYLDQYEIREDGTLWHEAYDVEDRSEFGKWRREHPNEEIPDTLSGLGSLAGMASRINKHWEQVKDFTGEIQFYTGIGKDREGWVEFSAYFVNGTLNQLHVISHEPIKL